MGQALFKFSLKLGRCHPVEHTPSACCRFHIRPAGRVLPIAPQFASFESLFLNSAAASFSSIAASSVCPLSRVKGTGFSPGGSHVHVRTLAEQKAPQLHPPLFSCELKHPAAF